MLLKRQEHTKRCTGGRSRIQPEIGDIKLLWEPSRLDELVYFAQLYGLADTAKLVDLNAVVLKWVRQNVAYRGGTGMCAGGIPEFQSGNCRNGVR